jgi:vacuolar-type H+-ATPase subunit H
MEKTIGKIFEIEEKAKLIIDRANQEKLRMHDEFEEELKKLERDIIDDNMKKINAYREKLDKELEQEKAQLIHKTDKQLEEMEENYRKNHDELIRRILDSILQS